MVFGKPLRSGNHVTAEVLVRRHAVQLIIRQRNDSLLACDVTCQRTWNTDSGADVEVCGDTTGLLDLTVNCTAWVYLSAAALCSTVVSSSSWS